MGDLRVFTLIEALGRLVPVRSDSLTCQLNFVLILPDDLAEAKVGDFHLTVVEYYVLGLQVVVDNLLLLVCQVLETGEDL